MKEMHKWKDKVEVTLDNRQIFFLFFGVSVVGCFVFGLGMMVGRRIDFDVQGEGVAQPQDSLALLQTADEIEDVPFSFKEGLREDTNPVPQAATPAEEAPAAVIPAAIIEAPALERSAPEPPPKRATSRTPPPPPRAKPQATKPKPQAATPAPVVGKNFTLQMKAFSKQDEADAFAAQLRAHGHDVRVESHDVKGRIWYRVRVGAFETWSEGLAAKEAFEGKEKIIAYVVRQ